jgi:hypothetical protein
MTRTTLVAMPNTLTLVQKRHIVEQMAPLAHAEGCWAEGAAHHGCAVAHFERLEAAAALIAERAATIATLSARLAVAEADYLRRHKEPAERYERIAQLEAHNIDRHQVRLKRIKRLRILQAQVRAAETNELTAAGFRELGSAVLAEIDALLQE